LIHDDWRRCTETLTALDMGLRRGGRGCRWVRCIRLARTCLCVIDLVSKAERNHGIHPCTGPGDDEFPRDFV
jgi:hypothetical protein